MLPFSITFGLTKQDYWQAFRLAQRNHRGRVLVLKTLITTLILVAFGLALQVWQQRHAPYCQLETVLGAAGAFMAKNSLVMVLLLFIPVLWLDLIERGMLRLGLSRIPSAFVERTWEFSEKKIHIQAPSASSDVKWDYFTAWRENDAYFLMMHGKYQYSPLPKRSMNEEQIASLRKMLQERIRDGAR